MPKLPAPGRRWPLPEPVRWYHLFGATLPWIALGGWLLWTVG